MTIEYYAQCMNCESIVEKTRADTLWEVCPNCGKGHIERGAEAACCGCHFCTECDTWNTRHSRCNCEGSPS